MYHKTYYCKKAFFNGSIPIKKTGNTHNATGRHVLASPPEGMQLVGIQRFGATLARQARNSTHVCIKGMDLS